MKSGRHPLLSLWVLYWAKSCSKASVMASGQRAATSLMALILQNNNKKKDFKWIKCISLPRCLYFFFSKRKTASYPTVMTSPEFLSVTKLLAMVMMTGSMICRKEVNTVITPKLRPLQTLEILRPYIWWDELVGRLSGTQENLCHLFKKKMTCWVSAAGKQLFDNWMGHFTSLVGL